MLSLIDMIHHQMILAIKYTQEIYLRETNSLVYKNKQYVSPNGGAFFYVLKRKHFLKFPLFTSFRLCATNERLKVKKRRKNR